MGIGGVKLYIILTDISQKLLHISIYQGSFGVSS